MFCAFPQPASRNHSPWKTQGCWSGCVLKDWVEDLRDVLTVIFNTTFRMAVCPALIPHPPVHERLLHDMLSIDFSSAFNTIIPQQLIRELDLLRIKTLFHNWILDFLTERPQPIRTSKHHTKHNGRPRMSDQSPAFHPVDPWLCTAPTYSSNHFVNLLMT